MSYLADVGEQVGRDMPLPESDEGRVKLPEPLRIPEASFIKADSPLRALEAPYN